MQESELYRRIRAEIQDIPLIDTHEHLMSEKTRLNSKIDFFYWFTHYASRDLVSAGLPENKLELLLDTNVSLEQRWTELAPFWKYVRTTGYGRALLIAARDLFDIDDINEETYKELSKKISASNHNGWYEYVLKERSNIDVAILNISRMAPMPLEEVDRRFFVPVVMMDDFILPCNRVDLATLEQKTGVTINSLDDLLKAIDTDFERAVAAGVVGIKIAVAYLRSLYFENVTKADAERVFNQLRLYPIGEQGQVLPPVSWAQAKPLQDYLMHQVVRRSIELNLPIQVHTGLQEGNGNFISNSNPLHLVNLLIEYPEARFDLFHAGYPFHSEMATLGKCFPNAYVDMCWLHVISPWVARQTLHEWIETIPANKIFAFGGDYVFIEGTYAHACMARDNIASVLVDKVESGYLNEDEASVLAHQILRDNAIRLFKLSM